MMTPQNIWVSTSYNLSHIPNQVQFNATTQPVQSAHRTDSAQNQNAVLPSPPSPHLPVLKSKKEEKEGVQHPKTLLVLTLILLHLPPLPLDLSPSTTITANLNGQYTQ